MLIIVGLSFKCHNARKHINNRQETQLTLEEEVALRESIAKDIESLMEDGNGQALDSLFAIVWIKRCADRARGIA